MSSTSRSSRDPRRPDPLAPEVYRDLVRRALAEDLGTSDVTTAATVPASATGRGVLLARSPAVVAGLDLVREVFAQVDPRVVIDAIAADGDRVAPDDEIARLAGPAAALLTGERTALNFLQYLSGIATLTRTFVDAAGPRLGVLDTRKTTPTFRALAKYAVRCGGGINHRIGLYDGILIKDNHIRLAGGVAAAVARARAAGPALPVEVETESLAEVDAALDAGADIIMLDNLDDETMRRAIARIAGRARVELSGRMTVERVRGLADSGADWVSVGAITHSAPAADISLEIELTPA
jgi:nicotinate-nucleotide pyrophosphorylase (carboxylating)